jgi:hypothetical protein
MQAAAPRYSMQRTAYSGYSSVASSSSSYRPVLHVCHHCTPQAARCRATPRTPPGDSSSPTIGSKSSNQKPAGQQELPPELATFAASIQGRTFHCTMCGKCCTMEGPVRLLPVICPLGTEQTWPGCGRIAYHPTFTDTCDAVGPPMSVRCQLVLCLSRQSPLQSAAEQLLRSCTACQPSNEAYCMQGSV